MTVQIKEAVVEVHETLYYVNDISQDNKSPLHYAAKQGHSDVVQGQLDRGFDVNVVDNVSFLNYIILS